MACRDIALSALDHSWHTETEIAAKVGDACSRSGLRHGLMHLASQKRAEMKETPAHTPGRSKVHVYRLPQEK